MQETAHQERRKATYQDLMEVPNHLVAEIIDGELITSPRPAPRHALTSSVLLSDLMGPFHFGTGGGGEGPGGWWILNEPELHLGKEEEEEIVVPDVAGWRRDRMPRLPEEEAFFRMAPDWVCEVVSPSTVRLDRVRKMAIYAREKVPHLWLIDPLARTLEVYRLKADGWFVESTHAGAERVRVEPFDAEELDMNRWWLPPAAGEGREDVPPDQTGK